MLLVSVAGMGGDGLLPTLPLCLRGGLSSLLDLPPWSELTGLADGRMNLAAPLIFGKL